jgi:predicted metalloprotease with PDZ domain
MEKYVFLLAVIIFVSCNPKVLEVNSGDPKIVYNIDLKEPSDDLFHVTIKTENLNSQNNFYNFAATAPGTYQKLDFGRFVKTFKAIDKNGNELQTKKISTNKYEIENINELAEIKYDIEDSFDAPVEDFPVPPMCGSGIEDGYIALNTFAVLGYFENLQSYPVKLKVEYDPQWSVGTSLNLSDDGYYYAETFDRLADSPLLIGKLTKAETYVNDISVQTFVFSSDTTLNASKILDLAEDVLQSASGFIGYSPVKEYKFLMCLLDEETFFKKKLYGGGALEHSYSSLYVMPTSSQELTGLRSTMAHEFLHILTPLFLHSEIIQTFNFENPTPSKHIWLYEGVTEWASDIMQLRAGLINSDRYMEIISQKLRMNDSFDSTQSLIDVALNSYNESGFGSFLNFYEKGAVVASLLDIRLLELSNCKKGLREVFLDLLNKYGKNKPFSEEEFFKVFVDETYPEIAEFMEKYIKGSEKLPYELYYEKIGYKYIPERTADDERPSMGINISLNDNMELITMGVSEVAENWGIEEGDVILEILEMPISMENIREVFTKVSSMKVGDNFTLKVRRGDEEKNISGVFQLRKEKHIFIPIEKLSVEQEKFKKIWSKNLN